MKKMMIIAAMVSVMLIPAQMEAFTETLAKLPTWESICHQRDDEQIKG